eukprot:RCo002748
MSFGGITSLGPQNQWLFYDGEPNAFNTALRERLPRESLPEAFLTIGHGKPTNLLLTSKTLSASSAQSSSSNFPSLQATASSQSPSRSLYRSHRKLHHEKTQGHCRDHADPNLQWHTPVLSSHEVGWARSLSPEREAFLRQAHSSLSAKIISPPAPGLTLSSTTKTRFPIISSDETKYRMKVISSGIIW